MLDERIAQKMVDEFANTIDFNINIMDENGTIIASADPGRIGTFHEIAWQMLQSGEKTREVFDDEHLLGTKSGVNMALEYRNSVIGIVGVTGNPDEARQVATLLKTAVENLYEFEMQQTALLTRTTMKDRLFQQLLYYDDPDPADLVHQAAELGYETDCLRIPILIHTKEAEQSRIAAACKASDRHTKQDILIRAVDGQTLVFLKLESSRSVNAEYRGAVEAYLEPIRRYAAAEKIQCRYLVGTMQKELAMYRAAFRHCTWLARTTLEYDQCVYFYDHVRSYLYSRVPPTELRDIFQAYVAQQPEKFWENCAMVLHTMHGHMNNMVQSSQELHMHKNTLVYRYNNIRQTLGIDPMNRASDNDFAQDLCSWIRSAGGSAKGTQDRKTSKR